MTTKGNRSRRNRTPIHCKRQGCPGIAAWRVTVGTKTEPLCHEHRNDVVFGNVNEQVSEERIRY